MTATELLNTHRVYSNIAALIAEGQFPGHAAAAIVEARQFLTNVILELKAKLDEQSQEETGTGNGGGADSGGVAVRRVPNRRQQNSRKKNVGT